MDALKTGYRIEEEDHGWIEANGLNLAAQADDIRIPKSIDVRSWLTPFYQDDMGSCVGHGGSHGATFANWGETAGDSKVRFSRMWCYLMAQKYSGHLGGDDGSTCSALIKALMEHGICREEDFPYPKRYVTSIPQAAKTYAARHKFQSHTKFRSSDEQFAYTYRGLGGTFIGIDFYVNIAQTSGIIRRKDLTGKSLGGHCMALCGYSPRKDSAGRNYRWLINSHRRWGLNGSGWAEVEPSVVDYWIQDRRSEVVGIDKPQVVQDPDRKLNF